jgi:hypothetical protein
MRNPFRSLWSTSFMAFSVSVMRFIRIFCLWVWIKCKICKIRVDRPDELLSRSLDAAVCIKKRADQLRRTACDLHTPVVKCTDIDGGIFDHVL